MSMKPEVRARLRAEMQPIIEAWRASGGGRREWAVRHGLSVSKFDYWARQFGPPLVRRGRRPAGFAAVEVVAPSAPSASTGVIEVVFANGDRLVIRAEAEATMIRAVLSALGGRC